MPAFAVTSAKLDRVCGSVVTHGPTSRRPQPGDDQRKKGLRTFHLRKRHRFMVMNQLPFIIIFRARHAAFRGDGLRRFIGLEPLEQILLARCALPCRPARDSTASPCNASAHLPDRSSQTLLADTSSAFAYCALQKQNARDLIQHHAIARILRFHPLKRFQRAHRNRHPLSQSAPGNNKCAQATDRSAAPCWINGLAASVSPS